MRITREQVEHVADLARLYLTEEEADIMTEQLDRILEYMDKLNELNTSDVEPTSHVIPVANAMRDDVVKESIPVERALENAPSRSGDFFKVPKIIE